MSAIAADALLRLPVRLHGIQLGRPVDLLLDGAARTVVGLDVLCGDEVHRFLPLAVAERRRDEICVRSAFLLLDDAELDYYRRKGRTLSRLRGTPVENARGVLGALRDLELEDDGSVRRLLVDADGAERWVGVEGLQLGGSARAA
jgi:hypothetical protein